MPTEINKNRRLFVRSGFMCQETGIDLKLQTPDERIDWWFKKAVYLNKKRKDGQPNISNKKGFKDEKKVLHI